MNLDEALDIARVTPSTADGGPLDALRVLSTYAMWARGELGGDLQRDVVRVHRQELADLRAMEARARTLRQPADYGDEGWTTNTRNAARYILTGETAEAS